MTSATELQNLYVKLYTQMRLYIWNYTTIELLADFEIAVYQRFPDLSEVTHAFDKLRSEISHTDAYTENKDLRRAFETFDEAIEEIDSIYANLETFKEVVEL